MKKIISTDKAPKAIGPYSQAVRIGNLLFVSGQISICPKTNEVQHFDGNVAEQTKLVLNNLGAILAHENLSLSNVVKTTVFLRNMDEFAAMNGVYEQFFSTNSPARATLAVTGLPAGVQVEIEAIAHDDA